MAETKTYGEDRAFVLLVVRRPLESHLCASARNRLHVRRLGVFLARNVFGIQVEDRAHTHKRRVRIDPFGTLQAWKLGINTGVEAAEPVGCVKNYYACKK